MAQKFLTDIELTQGLVDSSGDLGVAGQVLSSTGSGTNWITNEANSTVIYLDEFTGDNSTVDFTISVSVTDENITQVYIDGVYQNKDTYSVSGSTLTFSTAPPLNADIEVITFSTATTSDDLAAGSVIIPVKNTHTASIAKGEPVYITGNVGASARLEIAPADASNSAKMPAAGLLLQTLAVNAEGYVITGGYLRNITTDTIDSTSTSSNDTVYVKSGGGLTMTKPTGTNLIQNIAKVARSSGGNSGSLLVSSILRTNDIPNITNDYFWLGNSSGVATPTEFTSTARGLLSVGAEGTAAGDGNLAYNNSSGVFTYTPPVLGGLSGTTDNITEGSTNLYYTDTRVGSYLTANNYLTASSTHTLTNKSGNISQWTNDSGYITDGNTNWDNSYGFITASSTETLTNKSGNISMFTNDSNYATQSYVNTQVSNLVDSAPGTLDTLNELAAALGDDANFSTTVTNSIATKMPLAGGTFTGNVGFNDSTTLSLGASGDLFLIHDATNSIIGNSTGNLIIRNDADDSDIIFQSDNGSGGRDNYLTIDGGVERIFVHKLMRFDDDVQLRLGDNNDIRLYHNSTSGNGNIENHVGHLYVTNYTDDGDIIFRSDDGSGGVTEYLTLDGSLTQMWADKDLQFSDNIKAKFGASSDLQIYHDGSNSYINESGTGVLSIQSDGTEVQINKGASEYMGRFITDAGVKLYYDNSLKFETTSTGIQVTGNVASTGGLTGTTAGFSGSITASGNSNSFGNTTIAALSASTGTFSASVTAAGNSNSFGTTTFSGDLTLDDGAGASPSIVFKNASDETWSIFHGSQGVLNIREGTTDRLEFAAGGNATFTRTVTAGDGTQAINADADLTLRNGNSFVGIDLKSARTSGNIGGLRHYGTASDSVPVAQFLVETDGQLKYYNGTNGAETRFYINSSGDATFTEDLTINGNLYLGDQMRIGDDAWIEDFNIANAIKIKGNQNNANGYIAFGSQNDLLGRAGTGDLTWGGVFAASTSVKSPIFYDSNNTNRYLNPASTSRLRSLELYQDGDFDIYVSDNDAWIHCDARDEGTVAAAYKYTRSSSTGYGAYKEYWYDGNSYQSISNTNDEFVFSAGITSSGEITSDYAVSVSAVDVAGNITPSTDEIRLSGYGFIGNRGAAVYITNSNSSGSIKLGVGGAHNANTKLTVTSSGTSTTGNSIASSSHRAPIFYDVDDTNYYTNPNSDSVMNQIHINDYIRHNGDLDTYMGFNGANSWKVHVGGGDRLIATTSQFTSNLNVAAPIYYDKDSTAHYVHPGNLSNLSGLNVQYGNMDLRYSNTVDMTGSSYNQSTYYPVRIYVSDITRIRIENRLNAGGTHPSWATHGSGFSLVMDWYTNGSGWGTVGVARTLRQWNEAWANVTICGGITQMTNSSAEVVWLRGGGKYLIKTSFNNTVQVSSSSHTGNSQTVTPTTSIVNNVYSSVSGSIGAGNIYGHKFWDAGDANYFLNPADTSISLKVKGTAEFVTAAGNLRGYIRATDTNDSHFIIATSGGEDIAFKDGGTSGSTNMIIRGDGDVFTTRNHYAQTFYDSNNSTYYTNPASTSNMNAATFAGNIIGQNAYFGQDVGIGFTSGNIGGNLNIRNSAAGQTAAKIELGSSSNGSTIGAFIHTGASYASSGMFLNFQSNHISGDDNVLICYLDGDLVNKNNSYTQYSDERLKENIVDATSKLEEIKQIRVRNFNFIGEDLKQIGVVAQELEPIFPALVKEREVPGHDDPVKTVKYSVMVPILIKAMQELTQEVQTLKDQINGIN